MNMMKYKKFGGSARRTPTKIIFNRKVYTLFSVQKSKQNALDFKREFKRRGFLIRVIKNGKNYELYKSNSIKNKRKRVTKVKKPIKLTPKIARLWLSKQGTKGKDYYQDAILNQGTKRYFGNVIKNLRQLRADFKMYVKYGY